MKYDWSNVTKSTRIWHLRGSVRLCLTPVPAKCWQGCKHTRDQGVKCVAFCALVHIHNMVVLHRCTCSLCYDLDDREAFHSQRTVDKHKKRDRRLAAKRTLAATKQRRERAPSPEINSIVLLSIIHINKYVYSVSELFKVSSERVRSPRSFIRWRLQCPLCPLMCRSSFA